jgi:hypothetical protein
MRKVAVLLVVMMDMDMDMDMDMLSAGLEALDWAR